MIKNEFLKQYDHTWNVFERLVNDFDSEAWKCTGRGTTTPVRLSLHILQATKYYLEDQSEIYFVSGKAFDRDSENTPEEDEYLAGDSPDFGQGGFHRFNSFFANDCFDFLRHDMWSFFR